MNQERPPGYFVVPSSGNGSGILVLHAWWGLNKDVKDVCDKLVHSGFVAYAPDLYGGKIAHTEREAETAAGGIFENIDQAKAVILEASAYLAKEVSMSNRALSVLGFSLGGYFALDLTNTHPELIRTAVVYYATGPTDFARSEASYLGHFAEFDVHEPQANVDSLERTLQDAGRPVTFYRYAGTKHWFAEPGRAEAYNADAATLAWKRTIDFLGHSMSRPE